MQTQANDGTHLMLGEGSRTGPDGRRRTVVSPGRRAPIVDRPIIRGFHKVCIATAVATPGTIYTGTNGGTVATITTTAIAIGFWRKRSIVLLLLLLLLLRGHRHGRRRRKAHVTSTGQKADTVGEAIWHRHRRSVGPRGGRTGRDSDHVVQNVLPGVLEVSELRLDLHVHVGWTELLLGGEEKERNQRLVLQKENKIQVASLSPQ